MNKLKHLFFNIYFLIFAIYTYLNKGIAYSYFVEILLILGVLFIIINYSNYQIIISNKIKLNLIFLIVTIVSIFLSLGKYKFINILQDSLIFNYSFFIFVIFIFKEFRDEIWIKLFNIYIWLPLVILINFILQYFVTILDNVTVFGNIPILLYKNGDMGVNLLIATVLIFLNSDKINKKYFKILLFLIVFDFFIISSYSRSGMISYLFCLTISYFYLFKKNKNLIKFNIIRNLPIIFSLVFVSFSFLKVKENFQGRVAGFEQFNQNIKSIFGTAQAENLENNEIWRILWWTKIINYSFTTDNIFSGKGLGINLAISDEITDENDLRSPHNFHLNILARFGIAIFFLWILWIFLIIKSLKKSINYKHKSYVIFLIAFIINSSFDVYLEGPMGAFPFWTFVGLLYIEEFYNDYKPNEIPN